MTDRDRTYAVPEEISNWFARLGFSVAISESDGWFWRISTTRQAERSRPDTVAVATQSKRRIRRSVGISWSSKSRFRGSLADAV
jgi:hypothetical protein